MSDCVGQAPAIANVIVSPPALTRRYPAESDFRRIQACPVGVRIQAVLPRERRLTLRQESPISQHITDRAVGRRSSPADRVRCSLGRSLAHAHLLASGLKLQQGQQLPEALLVQRAAAQRVVE